MRSLLAALVRMLLLAATSFAACAIPAAAHDARPVSLSVREVGDHRYTLRVRAPESISRDNQPFVVSPPECEPLRISRDAAQEMTTQSVIECPGGIEGKTLTLSYPIYNPSLSTLFRLERLDGATISALQPPQANAWSVPRDPGRFEVLRDYFGLGLRHIAGGFDHLLFVAGLLVIAGTWRRVLAAVTGFTIAHSATLALSALDLVRLPAAPVEAAIALSILFLAFEIIRQRSDSLTFRYPALVASVFGLLHGFGFAGVLRDIGIPQSEIVTALLAFNLGVEAGQLVFVAVLLFCAALWRGAGARLDRVGQFAVRLPGHTMAAYLLGTCSTFWLLQRLTVFG